MTTADTTNPYTDADTTNPYWDPAISHPGAYCHPEAYCQRCKNRNIGAWYVDSAIWNQCMREGDIVCPSCFVFLHEQTTGTIQTWALVRAPSCGTESQSSEPVSRWRRFRSWLRKP